MQTELLFSNIARHIELSTTEKSHVASLIEEQFVVRNEFILQQGDPCHFIHFVNSGTLRAYFLNANGKEATIMFAIKDWWITDMYCFLNRIPALVNIQAVEKSSILKLSLDNLNALYQDIPAFNILFRALMQGAYCREQLRMIQNLSLSAAERYQNFLVKYPEIAQKVPLKQIASYLGITPEFLSAIRGQKV